MLKESHIEDKTIHITYHIPAKRESVFDAWKDAKRLVQWMGPEGVICQDASSDFQVGGSYRIQMKSPQGEHIAIGEYKEIIANSKLAFTWEWKDGTFKNSLVTITLTDQDEGTLVTLIHELLPNQEQAEHHTQGWIGCLTKLESYTKTNS